MKELGSEFSFSCKWRTEEATFRDLLSHKMGIELGESDFGWLFGGMKRSDILRYNITYQSLYDATFYCSRLAHIPFCTEFRRKLVYNNFMYTILGIVSEQLAITPQGSPSWEALVKDKLFDILGMKNAAFLDKEIEKGAQNIAHPHMKIGDDVIPLDMKANQ